MESRVRRKASFIVSVIDDVTNKIVKDRSIRVAILGEKMPIFKQEGYYVFINLNNKKGDLLIESEIYQPITLSFDLIDFDLKEPKMVRVYPNPQYPFTDKVTYVEGIIGKEEKVFIYSKEIGKNYRLMKDYDRGEEDGNTNIVIYHSNDIRLEEKILWIRNKEEAEGELIHIKKCLDSKNGLYQIDKGLSECYKKADTILQTVFFGQANEDGKFYVPILNIKSECNCFYEVSKKLSDINSNKIEFQLSRETGNRI